MLTTASERVSRTIRFFPHLLLLFVALFAGPRLVLAGSAPSITSQPVDQWVAAGDPATFSVTASGSATLTYQWQKNGANIAGATASVYTTPPTVLADNGALFRAVVTNSRGSATSNGATLTVSASPVAPTVTTQPVNQTVLAGQTATFSVAASGTMPISYQWQKNGANIVGATGVSYTTPAATAGDNGAIFRCVVTNSGGPINSSGATLTVISPSSPTPGRVLVVYCANWPQDTDGDGVQDSLQTANYYAAKRGVPAANLLGVTTTNDSGNNTSYYYYTGEYAKFYSEMVTPIQNKLNALGPTNIDVILMCYGTPYLVYTPNPVYSTTSTVCIDNYLMGLFFWNTAGSNLSWSGGVSNPYCETTPGFGADKAHFDHVTYKFNGTNMYLVSRIDGPRGLQGTLDLVDQARYGDRYVAAGAGNYNGFAYVDSRFGQAGGSTPYTDAWLTADTNVTTGNYGSYQTADENMAYAEHYVLPSGFTLKWENTVTDPEIGEAGATFSDSTSALTAPRALFYGGWYNFNKYNDVYSWLPGSTACDLNSNSLFRLRQTGSTFGGNALLKGATCVAGVIDEPYLTGHPRPNILMYYMLQGYTFAEAAGLANPAMCWQPINVGDPLYAPLRAKTIVTDTQSPAFAAGYPLVTAGGVPTDQTISLLVDDAPEPEVVQVQLQYGLSVSYGTNVSSGQGFWRRHRFPLTGLVANTTYHYRLVLTDPSGNVTTSPDFTFFTGSGGNLPPTILSSVTATPNPVVNASTTSLFVSASDPDAGPAPLTYTWSKVSGPGTVTFSPNSTTGASTTTATFSASGTYTLQVTVSDGAATATSQISGLSVTLPNNAPTVATAAAATPNPVTGTTAVATVFGADDGGEAALTYTWSATGPAAVAFSPNGTNAAKNSTATFTQAGSYTFTATLKDGGNLTVTSTVSVTVNQTLATITVAPASVSVVVNQTQAFSATGRDQFGAVLAIQPAYTWSVSGGGVINGGTGLFTAGASVGGPFTVTAASGTKTGTAQVTVTSAPNNAPTVATAAGATPTTVTGTTAGLNVLGADDNGEAALTYTWSATGPAGVAFSPNGSNAAKNSTATFTQAGSYTLTATIKDAGNLTVTSAVTVTVNQTFTTVTVAPATASVVANATQSFTATARDQFGAALSTQPAFTWSVAGGGTINGSGVFAAGSTAGGPFTVTATSGGKSGTGQVTVTAAANQPPVITTAVWATPNPVVNSATATISVTASDPDSGPSALTYTWSKLTGPGTVTFSPNGTTGANPTIATFGASGTYALQVSVSDGAASVTSQITGLSVTLPTVNPVTVDVTSLSFTVPTGSTTPVSQTISLTNTSGGAITVTPSTGGSTWLNGGSAVVIPSGNTVTLTVTADPTGLSGTVTGSLTLTNSTGGVRTLPVTLTVGTTASSGRRSKGCNLRAGASPFGGSSAGGLNESLPWLLIGLVGWFSLVYVRSKPNT